VAADLILVAPVPAEAPEPPARWRTLGTPSAVYPYRDAEGRRLRYVLRFTGADGRKTIRPATLWRAPDGGLAWRLAAEPGPRPLYGLDRLAARPEAPVLVVEGEKTADAAEGLFPEWVVVTWPGGAGGVGKADLSPLALRRAALWPDADDPGLAAVRALAQRLPLARIVDLPPGLPDGWDLADPWPAGLDLAEARGRIAAALASAAPASDEPPAGLTHGPAFRCGPDGGWWYAPPAEADGRQTPPLKLCGPMTLKARAREVDGSNWSLVLDFHDLDGRAHREVVSCSELAGEGLEVRRRLMGAGLWITHARGGRERFQELLLSLDRPERATLVNACGWHGRRYVLPHRTVGDAAEDGPVIWRGRAGASHHRCAGSYEAWRAEVAAPMVGNPLGLFVLSAAFAAPLLARTVGEGGGFHLRGASSTGKTTLLLAAGSVYGGGGPLGFAQSWRNTDNALEGVALAHNDGLLALDELRTLAPEAAGLAAYALAAGASKGRMRAEGDLRPRPTWRVLILSTGEIGLADMVRLSKTKERAYAGQELRLLDLQADQGRGLGCWTDLHGLGSAAAFSEQVRSAASAHYGHALPMFVERFLEGERELLAAHRDLERAFLDEALRPTDHGQARRAALRFAAVAAAGELAALLGVVPWP
jgi:putative DNA primase/helicase